MTTESPPPAKRVDTDAVPTESETVPVGRNGVIDPIAMVVSRQPTCSTMTARLNAAFVAVEIVVGLVVVSDGAQNPPIQYQDWAMICCSLSTGSRVTIATSSTTDTMESLGATSDAAIPAKSPLISAP